MTSSNKRSLSRPFSPRGFVSCNIKYLFTNKTFDILALTFLTTKTFSELLLLGISTVAPLIIEGEGRLFLVFSKGFDENSSFSFSCSSCTNQILKLSWVKSENFDSCSVPGLFTGSTLRHALTIVIEKSDLESWKFLFILYET